MSRLPKTASFAERLRAGDPLVGTFVKTPAHQVVEVLATTGLDFVVLDAEHAPFDAAALDACILAGRAAALPVLVRVASPAPEAVLAVLDMGASGVLLPHMRDAESARQAAAAARYGPGGRGFSNSPRAGGYGSRGLAEHLCQANAETVVLAQIEDPEAVEHSEAIAAAAGVDAVFIGRADLAVAMGADSLADGRVAEAVARICEGAARAETPVGVFLPAAEDITDWRAKGVSTFVVGSDQAMLRAAGRQLAAARYGAGR